VKKGSFGGGKQNCMGTNQSTGRSKLRLWGGEGTAGWGLLQGGKKKIRTVLSSRPPVVVSFGRKVGQTSKTKIADKWGVDGFVLRGES